MSTEFFRKFIDIIKEAQEPTYNQVEGYVDNSTQDLVLILKEMINGGVPRVDNLVDSLNDAYGPDDEGATEVYIQQHPVVQAVRDICSDVQVALEEDEDDDEEAVIASFMPRIKKVYQIAVANGYDAVETPYHGNPRG
jgi:disulfide oxidoreductase YuzD